MPRLRSPGTFFQGVHGLGRAPVARSQFLGLFRRQHCRPPSPRSSYGARGPKLFGAGDAVALRATLLVVLPALLPAEPGPAA